jgi:hypothetical protein
VIKVALAPSDAINKANPTKNFIAYYSSCTIPSFKQTLCHLKKTLKIKNIKLKYISKIDKLLFL